MARRIMSPARRSAAIVPVRTMAAGLVALLAGGPAVARAAEPCWTVDRATSRLEFAVDIGGTTAAGRFDAWTAAIRFAPGRPEEGRVRVEIDMTSVSIDDPRARAVGDPAWLAVAAHPVAVFRSERFETSEDGALTVTGRLTLKDIEAPLTLTGLLAVEGARARAELSGTIMRLSHDVGVGQGAVAAGVIVRATVSARCDPKTARPEQGGRP